MDDDIIFEKKIKSSPDPVSIKITEKILQQMKKCVCNIYTNNGSIGTGFFTKIPFNSNLLPVLITNNHVLGEEDIKINKKIVFAINNEEEIKSFIIDENRKKYTNEEFDVTIIEIYENKDNIKDFLEFDDQIKNIKYLNNLYNNESIYLLHYPEKKNICVSYGQPPQLLDKKINHKCSTQDGSSGGPILILNNQKVIGIHYGYSKRYKNFNEGTLIVYPIIEFQEKIKKEEIKNEKNFQKEIIQM